MRAVLSVSDKTGLAAFARSLSELGFELVSTGGTAKALRAEGLAVVDVSQVTGFPEVLDGRVKTLHPAIHGGLLARRDHPEDMETLKAHGIQPFDVVVVNLYPFRETAAKAGASMDEVVEQIDIGGPSMLRAAAKNYKHVAAVVDPGDYGPLVQSLRAGPLTEAFRYELMRKVFAHTAAYDLAIAEHFAARDEGGKVVEEFPAWIGVPARKRQALRYGENPHQKAAWYAREGWSGAGLASAKLLQGKELSYNNLLDLHAASGCVRDFASVTAVIVKHNTPCGAASAAELEAAYRAARAADETSAFGGIVACNAPIDEAAAKAMAESFLEAVVAPKFSAEAREVLSAKKNLRLLELPALQWDATHASAYRVGASGVGPLEVRSVGDGLLVQEADLVPDDATTFRVVTKRAPSAAEREAMLFAWRIVKHVRSNAIVFASLDRTLAIGGGQTSRVESVELAARKGGAALRGSAVASDAFFPFRDGLDAAAKAGASSVIQPGGSVRDGEVIAAADEHGLAMLFTDRRHFRH